MLEGLGVPIRLQVSRGLRKERRQRVLKRLLGADDLTDLSFPHPRLSMSHSGSWTVAVLSESATEGTGVDLQLQEGPSARTARLFLTAVERAWVGSRSRELLRLWTVKEALFKADPDNAQGWFSLYGTDDVAALTGGATRADTGRRFRYTSIDLGDGFLSVATTVRREHAR